MPETRRAFVRNLTAAAGFLAAPRVLLAQRSIKPPPKPEPAEKGSPLDANPHLAGARAAKRAQMQRNAQEFRDGVEQLHRMTGELHEELQQTATTDVLSIAMYKKVEQIEKLAKQLKSKAKGG